MKIFSIVGWSGSGKTTLIARLIGHFRSQQRRVVAVKSAHAAVAVQPEGKDTARYLQAGAAEAYLLAGGELLRMTRLAEPATLLSELDSRLGRDDIVLLEGLTGPGIPRIEVAAGPQARGLKSRPEELAAVVAAGQEHGAGHVFHPERIDQIAAFMEAYHEE